MENNFFTTKLLDILVPVTEEKHLEEFNSIFFIMDYAEMDMHGLFSNPNVKISDAHVATILYNLLCGLKFMHSAGVIHRDIKPDNILITGECGVKLCDFGLSRTVETPKTNDIAFKTNYAKHDNCPKQPNSFRQQSEHISE